jgi:sulfur carrier protein ThiS adenylyltransferase
MKMTFKQIKEQLEDKTVGIAGCGGLGSNCAVALARVGIGNLVIADFDVVENSNLNRQYYFFDQVGQPKALALAQNIGRINPSVKVISYNLILNPVNIVQLFADCDVIVEAFDKAEMKEMIIETVATAFPEKPLIVGSGMAGWGKSNELKVNMVCENLFVCGDGITEIAVDQPPLAPRVGIVANMQANMVLEILLGNKKQFDL